MGRSRPTDLHSGHDLQTWQALRSQQRLVRRELFGVRCFGDVLIQAHTLVTWLRACNFEHVKIVQRPVGFDGDQGGAPKPKASVSLGSPAHARVWRRTAQRHMSVLVEPEVEGAYQPPFV